MTTNKTAIINEIASAFSLSGEAAQTACLLLEARAKTLDFTFDEYMLRYHPEGFAEKDESLGSQWQGYVQFLGDDVAAILRAGRSANFSTFVHECAHVFRRQLTGELREQAEKAFGIEGGVWSVEKEDLFARGLEQWIKRRHGKDKTRANVYNKGKSFVNTVYRGMERIVEIDSRMEEVYERLFEDDKYIFKQNKFEEILAQVAEGKLPNDSHIFLGMTPRIYEEVGLLRLPMAMTGKHLYSTLRASGDIENVNYHNLGEDILRQLPEQLKKPLCIIQSDINETDIVSIIALKDKNNNQIVVPVAYSQKGNFNGAEIDINLVKSIYGKEGFEQWLEEAIKDNRLLYINKKETEPVWMGQGFRQVYQHFPDRSIRLPDGFPHSLTAGPTTDVFGFLPENIAHYREAVKHQFPERFTPAGERILYKSNETQTEQLSLDFSQPDETGPKTENEPPKTEQSALAIPHPNTPENFRQNFVAIAGEFKADTIEAARFLLRGMSKEDRAAALAEMQNAGCTDREGYHRYLFEILSSTHEKQSFNTETDNEKQFWFYGAWTDFNSRLSVQERKRYNNEAIAVLEKAGENTVNDNDRAVLRRYSGFGGISAAGERGVLYDYYTSPPVARLVWQLLEKSGSIEFGAKVLEPSCGTGVFFEFAPKKPLSLTGVELDSRTAQVAQHLFWQGNIKILNQSFEAFNLSDKAGNFDHVVGNAPFGERSAGTAALDVPEEKSLDNYFVSRSIDNLKDGGTMALIVTPGVLENKTNEEFRLSLNKKAQFIGAVKLPNRSFRHSHTQVMPDILLFRKYPDDIQRRIAALDDDTFKATGLFDSDFVSGTYFDNHPEHIAGTLSRGTGQWGNDEVKGDITPESMEQILSTFTPADSNLENIFRQIKEDYQLPEVSPAKTVIRLSGEELSQVESKMLRHGAIKIDEHRVYLLTEDHQWALVSENKTLADKLQSIKAIADTVHAIQDGMKGQSPAAAIQELQQQCRDQIAGYRETYKAIPDADADVRRFTRENPAVQGIYEALLPPDDPLLHTENVYRKNIELLDGHNAAVSALLALREKMKDGTEANIRAFFPDEADALMQKMREHNDVFITPQGEFQLREDFIAGDAWEKIDTLRQSAERETEAWKKKLVLHGADELEKAVGWTPIENADFSPRSSWIPAEIVREWASSNEALGLSHLVFLAKNDEGKWGKLGGGAWQEMNDPLIYYLNGQKQRSQRIDTDAYNKEHDELFRSFISNHESYRARLESEYNRKFKTHIIAPVKTYPVAIAGWRNAEEGGKTVQPHQWQSVHHLYRQQCGISALGTGFGKTVTSIDLMSLLRQEGKGSRVFLQVPNNKVKDWIEEIRDVMPSLKIASIDPEEPGYSSRDRRYAKYQAMARSDADIIIMPESAGSEIQLSPENDERVSKNVSMLYRMEKSDGTARQQERAAQKGEYKARSGKTNVTVCFEDFGCDVLIVDEAHRYKNLFSSTLSRETGLNDGRQSAKAMSLYKKSEYIREQNNGKNVFLLTATPLTNSPLEYYNMMQYIAPEELRRMGISTIDGFIREFADIETGWMYDWGTGQAKQGRVLTGFKNLPTLQNLFFTYTDLQNNPEAVGIEKPLAENQPHIIAADEKQSAVIRSISLELDRYKSMDADERKDAFPGQNFLTFYSQMRTASLDLELYDPATYKNWKNPKLETMAHNAYASYRDTKGGQVIFCDRVFSSDASFNIHEKIKQGLIAQGFKEREIVIVNGFTKGGGLKSDSAVEKEVSKAIADYNAGKYKAIIGSTACIGEGVNLQKNSSGVHHFDIPFRPSDFIQRNGRVDRQGNSQEKVGLHTYLAAGTIDNYSVNLVQRKANWIDQLLRTKSEVFTNPNDENSIDADELLLALTEEWGDKDAALKRREELERQKNEKIKEAQTKQMKGHLKNLSLARGAIHHLRGGKDTKEYKKLAAQIANTEAALKNNPVFNRHDILENSETFIYNGTTGSVYRRDDVLVTRQGRYVVEGFILKKQELVCSEILSDKELREKKNQAREYGHSYNPQKIFEASELKPGGGMYYDQLLYHIEKTSKDDREAIKIVASKEFYNLPNAAKERWYDMHVTVNSGYNSKINPMVFVHDENGKLEVKSANNIYDSDTLLNPFAVQAEDVILKNMNTIQYNEYAKDEIIEFLDDMLPKYAQPMREAIKIAEARKVAVKKKADFKEKLVMAAVVKLNADEQHFKSHVHVVR